MERAPLSLMSGWACRRSSITGNGRSEEAEVLALPDHGGVDAVVAAGMIEEDPFFSRAWAHLAVFAEVDGGLGEAIWLAGGVKAEHVGFFLPGACLSVQYGRKREEENASEQ